ncbi:membrane-associated protein, putative [Bodo saltans]|uniref:Membrane-associated protein, putative n=1 Tax=Bodo saltans TaxID=75058 RepID=A0A0S4J669_BODSA|nr:membrane-associated protein, putative [Bodo saltans]|eukprot:CUG85899.1 membrane-associated protein, putative [Bodo saltans]
MKHLDLYARRDPQLAPYLLREVDIEFKRKCRKVSYCFWVGVITILMSYQYRLQAEELSYLRQYAAYCRASQDARDEDDMERRRVFVTITNTIKDAFNRDQRWRESDVNQCLKALE